MRPPRALQLTIIKENNLKSRIDKKYNNYTIKMFLSPSHVSANSEIEDDDDFYSSSKKIESKRKAQSISQMIRKVEHVIKSNILLFLMFF